MLRIDSSVDYRPGHTQGVGGGGGQSMGIIL